MPKKVKTQAPGAAPIQAKAAATAPAKTPLSLHSFWVQAVILAIIGFAFYCNTFQHEAAFDDRMAITDNAYVQRGIAGIPDILTKDAYESYLESMQGSNQLAGGRYRPLSIITFAMEQQMMGTDHDNETATDTAARVANEMHARHVVNVLLYILSVLVLLYFFQQVVFPGQPLAGFIAALLFVIHPVHTEVVANVKSRDELLSVLFISLTFIKAFRYADSRNRSDLLLALLCFFLALLSKEYAVTLIVLLPVSFYVLRKESIVPAVKAALPYLIPLGIYLALRFSAVNAMAEGAEKNILNNPYLYATGMQRIATEIVVLLDYVKLLFFPAPLIADYSYNAIPYASFSAPVVWLGIIVYSGLVAGMCVLLARRHVLAFAIAFYLANLVLVSNLLFNIGAPMGERLIYHSSVGFCIAAAWLLYACCKRIKQEALAKALPAGLSAVLVLACGYTTIGRNKDWKNDATLFMADVQKSPNSILVNNNAAAACMLNARLTKDAAGRNVWFAKAIGYFDKAIALYPMYMNARLNRGLSYFDMGQPANALPDWDTVRKYDPAGKKVNNYFSALGKYYYNTGLKYARTGKVDSAVTAFEKGTEAMPGVADLWYQLANAYKMAGKEAESTMAYNKAAQLKQSAPGNSPAR